MHSVPMLFVADVEATSKWYQDTLGLTSGHGGPEFEMLLGGDNVILQLHIRDSDHDDHGVSTADPLGNGVMVVIYVDDSKAAYAKAQEKGAEITGELHFNERATMDEFTLRDPNGYGIMVCEAHWD